MDVSTNTDISVAEPLSFKNFLTQSGLVTLGEQQRTKSPLIAVRNPTGKGPKTQPKSRRKHANAVGRERPIKLKQCERDYHARAAKGGPRISMDTPEKLRTNLQLQRTIPGMPELIGGVTDLFKRVELHIVKVQKDLGLSDEEIAAESHYRLPEDATVEEKLKYNKYDKNEHITGKFFHRMRGHGARHKPHVDRTRALLNAMGKKHLADDVTDGWQNLLKKNLYYRLHAKRLFTKEGYCSISICNKCGGFDCEGAPTVGCIWDHHVQPRRSIHDLQKLSVMELEHVIGNRPDRKGTVFCCWSADEKD